MHGLDHLGAFLAGHFVVQGKAQKPLAVPGGIAVFSGENTELPARLGAVQGDVMESRR